VHIRPGGSTADRWTARNGDNMWCNIILSVIVGVIASVIASLIWFYIFSRIRPNIALSPTIAKDISTDTKKPVYIIKIINKCNRSAVNIRADLSLVIPFIVPEGQENQYQNIPLRTPEIFILSKLDKKDMHSYYSFRFSTYENLEKLWKNDEKEYIRMRVYATDSVSGLGKIFEYSYRIKRNSIKEGTFKFGESFEIN
jgi:hypothetical protein